MCVCTLIEQVLRTGQQPQYADRGLMLESII